MPQRWDVLVVGGGNAGLSAALAAREAGASVLVVEKAPEEWTGGNSWFTAGGLRFPYGDAEQALALVGGRGDDEAEVEIPPYGEADFRADLDRISEDRSDPALRDLLVAEALPTVRWLSGLGVPLALQPQRHAYRHGDHLRYGGGEAIGVSGGGKGLIGAHLAAARRLGIEVRFDAGMRDLRIDEAGRVVGVRCADGTGSSELDAGAVVLACGGFEADAGWRAAHLGPAWEGASVRGTPHNTGDGLAAAIDVGAAKAGNWDGCHAVPWDAAAPSAHGDRQLTNRLTKGSYMFGITVNREGRRYLDEGADFREYTYVLQGEAVLRQPGAVAVQVFDAQAIPLLRSADYDVPGASRVKADTIATLARAARVDPDGLEATVRRFNAAVRDRRFDPSILDHKGTAGLDPPKSNWALRIERPPFVAYRVTCGITFTFGGLAVDVDGRVRSTAGPPIPGLHAAGEIVGGMFFGNYAAGSGLVWGSVIGRRAGNAAARHSASVAD